MYDFEYKKPKTLNEAKEVFKEADDATYLAGGMTLIPTLKARLAAPSDLIDLSGVKGLSNIREDGTHIEVGAMTCHGEVAASSKVQKAIPALAALAGGIGDPQVRNQGTIGGSIANNDPAADYPGAVLGLNATIKTDRRVIAADDFFLDLFETALKEDEIITAVRFPACDRAVYAKFPNPVSRYSLVGVFIANFDGEVRVAITGAGPCVFRSSEMEAALKKEFNPKAIEKIIIPPDDLNDDLHASAEYRAHLIPVMAKRAVAKIIEEKS